MPFAAFASFYASDDTGEPDMELLYAAQSANGRASVAMSEGQGDYTGQHSIHTQANKLLAMHHVSMAGTN